MDGDINNNQMESFNSNTLRMRKKMVRGLKGEDSANCRASRPTTAM